MTLAPPAPSLPAPPPPPSVPAPPAPPSGGAAGSPYRWTVDAFYRALDAGVFAHPKRLELMEGQIREKEPVNPPHADTTEDVANLLRAALGAGFRLREEKPLRISDDTELVPDIYVVPVGTRDRSRHPTSNEAVLVIEVADSSVEYDTGEKARLYARAGIPDYWVCLVRLRELWVYRNAAGGVYPAPLRLTENDVVSPFAAPGVVLAVRDLLPPAPVAAPQGTP